MQSLAVLAAAPAIGAGASVAVSADPVETGGALFFVPGYRPQRARSGGVPLSHHPDFVDGIPAGYDGPRTMVSRLRWDARLYHPPGKQPEGKRGRKPKKGTRQLRFREWAHRSDTPWIEEEIEGYGGKKKPMRLFSRTALWHTPGWDPLPLRFVLVRDPEGKLRDEVFFWVSPTWVIWRHKLPQIFQ